MEPEDLQLTNSSEVPHNVPVTGNDSSISRAMQVSAIVIYVVTCILGVLGNGLVIWATGFKLKRTAYTVWLLSLAVADFTFSLLLPLSITELALDHHWPFGWLLCKLHFWMLSLCVHASIFTLIAISVDRCFSLVLPVWSRNHRGPRLASLLSLGVWVVAAFLSAPAFVLHQLVLQGNRTLCDTMFIPEAWYQALILKFFLSAFLLPFLVIAASYTMIGLRLRWGRLVPSGGKPFRVMAAIILAFLLCWAPYNICSILVLLQPRSEPLPLALSVGMWLSYSLAYFNSCINPVLYIFMWQDFRDLLKKSLQRVNNQGESMQNNL
uniref:C3a anaphylatoxin chemotactic receptor-like n=1 Tax=Pristiophorus japonicus TaxID=55135 RepID=UPI00398EE6F1